MTAYPQSPPLVTVVIPTRNRRLFLMEAVESVRRQTYPNWELIVVDDCSEDDTWSWLTQTRDPRIQAVRLDRHSERGAARNVGLKRARGEYTLFLDDDDRLLPHALGCLVRILDQNPAGVFAAGGRILFDSLGNRRRWLPSRIRFLRRRVWRDVMVGWVSIPGTMLFRTRVLQAVGGWTEQLVVGEDQELLLRVGLQGACAIVPSVVLENRAHAGQWRPGVTAAIEEQLRLGYVEHLVGPDRQLAMRLLSGRTRLKKATEDYHKSQFISAARLVLAAIREESSILWSPLTGPAILALLARALAGVLAGRRLFAWTRRLNQSLRQRRRREVGLSLKIL